MAHQNSRDQLEEPLLTSTDAAPAAPSGQAGAGEPGEDVEAASLLPHAGCSPEEHGSKASGDGGGGGGKASWLLVTAVLLGDMFGLGTLTLPADFARLGWVPALILIAICALGMVYSGVLFTRLAQCVPGAQMFDDFGRAALGRRGQRLVYTVVYLTIFFEPVIFHLTTTEALQQMFYRSGLSRTLAGTLLALAMLPLAQVRGIEDVSAVSVLGTVGMVLAVGIATAKLWLMEPAPQRVPTEPVHRGDFNTYLVALMDIVFTYGGQVNWVRYITGLRDRSKFRYSVTLAGAFMTVFYVIMGSVGYWRLGYDFDHERPITSILPEDTWSIVMNFGLFLHCIFAYQINLNVWTHMVLHLSAPQVLESHTLSARAAWAAVSAAGIGFSFAVSFAFPYFSTVMAIIASIGDLTGAYALPALFVLVLMRDRVPRWERGLLKVLIPVLVALSAVGVYSSLRTLVQQFRG